MSRAVLLVLGCACAVSGSYWGAELGGLSELQHGVRGKVFAVDSRTIFLKDFHYDGEGPAAYFYVGWSESVSVSASGASRLRDERGAAGPLRKYRGRDVTLALPDGKTFRDIKWFAIWCDEFSVNFGDVRIPPSLIPPRPAQLSPLRGVHGVRSGPLLVVDAQTLLLPDFSYDGEAPDAKFWVGRGPNPSPQGIRIPDENGKEVPLKRYNKKTIVLTLPGDLTVFDIGHFGVWCEAFTVDFGHVSLSAARVQNVPPSLRMLGVSPQSVPPPRPPPPAAPPAAPPLTAAPPVTTYRPRALHRRADIQVQPSEGLYYQLYPQPLHHRPLHPQPFAYRHYR